MQEDSEILALYKEEGKADYAFNLIVRKYSERLYWHLRELAGNHEDANDLLQNSLIKIWNNLPTFRGESKLYTWIYRIATNEALTWLKKQRFENRFSLTNFDKALANKLTTDDFFNGDQIQLALQQEVMKLPDKQRAIFSMRYFQDMKYEEIAEITESNVGAVKTSYSIAYNKISDNLKKKF
ncbi:MAG: RNA polymerase sigma factor [Bacteroidales bacterium]|jgi:RNA polymerase sigma-70 factor, ECF subfamily|nr:RNA polymerase sigma factor [Bacteroidales bacterium]MCI1732890.1 RNA polymerase sigma factor [Bacteroidales bacterium]